MKICKKCNRPTEKKNQMFHYRGNWFSGLVCLACNALYDNPDDSFMDFMKKAKDLNENDKS